MIRPYQEKDKLKVLELCNEFWRSSCANEYGDYDHEHTSNKLDQLLSSGACIVCGDIDGFILLVETTALCSQKIIAAEVAWYVRPTARGGAGIKLLEAAINYCELKGIHALSMVYMQSSMPESIAKIYDKLGFKLKETTYMKRI